MFLRKYLSDLYFELLLEKYEEDYLESLNENNFIQIYNLFKKYNFYFIEDIILKHIEIFTLDLETVNKKLIDLNEQLGKNFVYLIGEDMRYLEFLLTENK